METKTIKIRLEAASFTLDYANEPFQSMRQANTIGNTITQAVVGRAIEKFEANKSVLVENIEIGERLCCLVDLPFPANGHLSNEVNISPYTAHKIPQDVNFSDIAACLIPCIRIYTALHTLVRIRKTESILIACPNDLNFTSLAMQICQNLNLRHLVIVANDAAFNIIREEKSNPKNVFKLDQMNVNAINTACDQFTGNLGFDCVLDFKNHDSDPSAESPPITFSKLIRLMASFGRIVTDRKGQPISASDVNVLHLKSSSTHFLFDQTWHLSPLYYGRYKHMLADIIEQVQQKKLRPVIAFEADPTQLEETMTKYENEIIGCYVFKF